MPLTIASETARVAAWADFFGRCHTTPVGNLPQRSVPGSASVHPGPLGRGSWGSKVGGPFRLPSVSLPSVAVGVDISAAPAPHEAVREISPGPQLRSPGTLPRQLPGLRRSPWLADTLPRGFLVCRREHTTPRIAKSVQPSP